MRRKAPKDASLVKRMARRIDAVVERMTKTYQREWRAACRERATLEGFSRKETSLFKEYARSVGLFVLLTGKEPLPDLRSFVMGLPLPAFVSIRPTLESTRGKGRRTRVKNAAVRARR